METYEPEWARICFSKRYKMLRKFKGKWYRIEKSILDELPQMTYFTSLSGLWALYKIIINAARQMQYTKFQAK